MGRRGRPPHPDVLTPREWEVLSLLRAGLSNEEIAERLGVTLSGAKYHVSEILSKLGVSSREEAARWSAPGGDRRPWWLAAVAPAGFLWRRANASWVSTAVAAGVAIAVGAGIGLLVWGLVRTGGGGEDAEVVSGAVGQLSPPAVVGACPDEGPLSPSGAPVFAYATVDGTIWVADADGTSQQVICGRTASRNAAWSPSGRYLAYVGSDGGLRLLDVETWRDTVIDAGTDGSPGREEAEVGVGGLSLRWSPAGELLAYQKFVGSPPPRPISNDIWVAGPETAPRKLVEAPDIWRYAWSPDGSRIVYDVIGGIPSHQLFLVNADGSGERKLTDGLLIRHDAWSPVRSSRVGSGISTAGSLNSWSPNGRLLAYWNEDRGGSSIVGDIHVMDVDSGLDFSLGEFTSDEQPAWSPDRSRYVFHNLQIDPEVQSATPLFDRPGALLGWSPDGSRVAYVDGVPFGPPPRSLVVLDIESGERSTLHTSNVDTPHAAGSGYHGVWSPDGRYYTFIALESEPDSASAALFVADTQSGSVERILGEFDLITPVASYSPDGSRLLIQRYRFQQPSVWIANADGSELSKVADGVALRHGSPWRPAGD